VICNSGNLNVCTLIKDHERIAVSNRFVCERNYCFYDLSTIIVSAEAEFSQSVIN
jgi:hypothetical protein